MNTSQNSQKENSQNNTNQFSEWLTDKDKNDDIVRELCRLAGYNTMVIELLAKASIYDELDEFYDRFVDERFNGTEDVPVRTLHDYNMIPDMDETEDDYFDAGNETAASQLIKLFNMKSRSETEQQTPWWLR